MTEFQGIIEFCEFCDFFMHFVLYKQMLSD
jgi:hypothetical protein